MDKQFEIRTYGFNELAQLYFPYSTPTSATRMFSKWIYSISTLKKSLIDQNWKEKSKYFTPKQVKILVSFLDPP